MYGLGCFSCFSLLVGMERFCQDAIPVYLSLCIMGLQILFGQHKDINFSKDKFKVVAESMSGLIFDSSPVEFESSIGAKVLSQQVLTYETGKSIPLISHGAHAVGRGLDYLFYRQFEHQKEEMWHALYSCVKVGPILVFCSELDELAPFETIQIFAANIRRLGGKINVVAWKDSKHVGHFRRYPDQYTKEVRSLLLDAISTFSHRKHQSSKWTDLPEAIVAEIYQMSRLPHLHVKMGSVAENVTDDGESAVLPKVDAGSEASQKHVSRSRL
ncbi:hypothetical protein KP509_31G070100 [Ceratopteris richardii]|uniref:Uncharacterized protein n=1 Tax=Ceratopteris richardii TaxID=49495 RepID=A0A8T2QYW1_CERRI|nr:hypothetical protein KP509_1Z263300 [Ceratopteris richardii]KAH7289322.1 hypothetical protein KP509_31G070100 [Ceratopteris richardii]